MISVMLCDDHLGFIEGVIEILKKYPEFKIIGKASSGADCIQLIDKGLQPNILLLDISMLNGISGYQVAKHIQLNKLPIKVVVVSMLDDLQAVKAMMRFGAKGFVWKGNSLKGIDAIIHSVYQGNEYYSEILKFSLEQIDEIKNTPVAWLENMHPQEWEVIQLISNDKAQKEVSSELNISTSLVSKRLKSLFYKTKTNSSIGLIKFFQSVGLIK